MPDLFPTYEVLLKKRGRTWKWCVRMIDGEVVMLGSESSRPAARYKADSALFLLLSSAPYRLFRSRRYAEPRVRPLSRKFKRLAAR
jgi:hypothetical protein